MFTDISINIRRYKKSRDGPTTWISRLTMDRQKVQIRVESSKDPNAISRIPFANLGRATYVSSLPNRMRSVAVGAKRCEPYFPAFTKVSLSSPSPTANISETPSTLLRQPLLHPWSHDPRGEKAHTLVSCALPIRPHALPMYP